MTTPTFRDTDGHYVNWVVDGSGRPIQTQLCTVTPAAGTACPSSALLMTNETWDANNNRTAIVNPRGGETDMAYDAAGDLVAIAQPAQYSGYTRPTTLIDYDGNFNVVAVCDPVLVHSQYADWNGQYSGGQRNYCTSQFSNANHTVIQYSQSTMTDAFGEAISVTSPTGYTYTISYDPSPQGGDFGLPSKIAGARTITQFDSTSRQPSTSFTYDANGNVICQQRDAGLVGSPPPSIATSIMKYDSMNRLVASSDADDSSLTAACTTAKVAGIGASSIVSTQTYYPDGSLATTQTPSEAALQGGTTYTYDLDGNSTSNAPYANTPQNTQTPHVKRWFDGMGRLVETQEPADPGTSGDIPISLRYVYDLSQGGTATSLSGAGVSAHGNAFDTLKNTATGWIDFKYSAFDATDRVSTAFAFAPCPAQVGSPAPAGAIYCSQAAYATRYDWDASSVSSSVSAPGLLVATTDGTGASRRFTYDGMNAVDSINYSGDGARTTPVQYRHDLDGRISNATNYFSVSSAPAQNDMSFFYTSDGMLSQKTSSALGTTVAFSYYPDSMLAGVSAMTTQSTPGDLVNQPNLYRYSYRNDGLRMNEAFGPSNQSVTWTYTPGGRMKSQTDFGGSSPSITAQYADGHGRLSSYTTPGGTYGSFVYDAQGHMTRYSDPYTGVDGEIVSSTYNVRGDLIARSFTAGAAASKPGFQYKSLQGVLVQNATDQFDGRTGATLITYDWGPFSYDLVGRLTSPGNLSYDAEGRLVGGDTFNASSAADDDCHSGGGLSPNVPPIAEVSYLYDAAGQLFQDTNPPVSILGHTRTPTRRWIWNGSKTLFTVQVNSTSGLMGPVDGYGADGLGSITPDGSSPGLTIADVDFDGSVALYHNNTGHSSWAASNPYNQFCQHVSPLPASASYVGPNANVPPNDGSSDSSLTVSSTGRAYLSRSMGFTTPDNSFATPYSSRAATGDIRGTLQYRATTADASCESGVRYADGAKECVPVIGGTGTTYGLPYNFGFENIPGTGTNPFGSHLHFPAPGAPAVPPNVRQRVPFDFCKTLLPAVFVGTAMLCWTPKAPLIDGGKHISCVWGSALLGAGVSVVTRRFGGGGPVMQFLTGTTAGGISQDWCEAQPGPSPSPPSPGPPLA